MNTALATIIFALPLLAQVACTATPDEAATSAAAATGPSGRAPVEVDASWHYVITGTPTYGNDATTPMMTVRVNVDDLSVRADDHPGFDGLEKPFVLVPRADGSTQRVELRFEGTSMSGYIQLYPLDSYASDTIWLTEADLAVVRTKGITVALETNVGVIESDNHPVSANNR